MLCVLEIFIVLIMVPEQENNIFGFNKEVCRKKDTAKTVGDDNKDYSLAFKLTVDNFNSIRDNSLLLDTGATATILNDKSTFLNFDGNFNPKNHYIELADGSRACGIVSAKGRAKVLLHDLEGVPHDVILEDAYLAICRTYFLPKQQSLREVP